MKNRVSGSGGLGQVEAYFDRTKAAADLRIVETPPGQGAGEPERDMGRHIEITIAPAAAEHQVEMAPTRLIPSAADDWLGHAGNNARIANWIHGRQTAAIDRSYSPEN
jgi:hypothetical protein